jgi:threonine synthase
MFVTHLECCRCGQTYESEQVINLCRCGSPLLVRYDLEKVKGSITKDRLASRKPNL